MTETPAADASAVTSDRLIVQAVMKTDVGLVRSENQDFGTYTTPSEERESHAGGRLLVVADGMGGHRGGATASRLAGETVKAQYLGSETADIAAALRDALTRANARIFSEAQANPDLRGMGTTTSALVVSENNAWFAHVGDSRIYLVRNGEIKQLTDDHSLVASMVREGLLTMKEAENHPRRNVLQRSMGVSEDVEIDIRGPLPVQENDIFILCSDGLHGPVKEAEMLEVASQMAIEPAVNELIRRALDRGAPDNVTVIIARIVRPDELTDDTVIDRRRDSTQEIKPIDPGSFDETQRDSAAPPLPKTLEAPAEAALPKTLEAPAEPALSKTLEVASPETPDEAPPAPAPPRKSFLKWMLIAALSLGAAGALVFWGTTAH
jgi:serine/threonine protein phosphatase PrpC